MYGLLTTDDWWQIHKQTLDFGFTLYDPQVDWKPEGISFSDENESKGLGENGTVHLPSGSFTAKEIQAIFKYRALRYDIC